MITAGPQHLNHWSGMREVQKSEPGRETRAAAAGDGGGGCA